MSNYATVADIVSLKRPLTQAEQERAGKLIPIVSSLIRHEAKKTGRDFDDMIYKSDLVSSIDVFAGDGATASFTLTNTPHGEVTVTVNDQPTTDFEISGSTITFTDLIPSGEILVTYDYRALADAAKAVVCDVVMREINTPGMQLPATSFSEAAGGVSQSVSLPNSSGAIRLWPSDLKTLGLKVQKIDALNMMKDRRCGNAPFFLPR